MSLTNILGICKSSTTITAARILCGSFNFNWVTYGYHESQYELSVMYALVIFAGISPRLARMSM